MNPSLEAQTFFDHYETVGWVVGKNKPMKCWQAAVRHWVSQGEEFNKPDNPGNKKNLIQKHADRSWAAPANGGGEFANVPN